LIYICPCTEANDRNGDHDKKIRSTHIVLFRWTISTTTSHFPEQVFK
jgi:hypothetical protein